MKIIYSKNYDKDYVKKIKNRHLYKEDSRIQSIIHIFVEHLTLEDVLQNPVSKLYRIEKKKGNIKELFTARINNKLRLIMKPIGKYRYNYVEIVEIEFLEIDDTHYGEG